MTSPAAATRLDEIRERVEAATPGPWLRGWWMAQAESMCDCSTKGPLLGKRPQKQYPGAGPFHVHATDFFEDEHQISGPAPECEPVAGNYGYEEGGIIAGSDSAFIAAAREDIPFLLAEVERLRGALKECQDGRYYEGLPK